ncbi:MAG: YbaN family protein [Roseiflexus sp.]|nr:YbaN family protein [Roseiflexus sp.]MCS7289148.1 YbaN family protein [Roseiflexus sp.]MDW8145236.1 YbaN family protein [Roseiflexaceae bacterium]MDW8234399.1 YbaN family protein [Roseiflexaceae bacterium]
MNERERLSNAHARLSYPLLRPLLLIGGTLFLILGFLGAFLPALPSTPFFLLAAALFFRSSPRLYGWMAERPLIRPHLQRFQQDRSMTLRAKVMVLGVAWIMLLAAAIFAVESLLMRAFLVGLAMIKTIVILRLRTARSP